MFGLFIMVTRVDPGICVTAKPGAIMFGYEDSIRGVHLLCNGFSYDDDLLYVCLLREE